jgi:ribosomal protein S18 acetylase RimI-like enzyme
VADKGYRRFALVDQFHGIRLDVDLDGMEAGQLLVVESERRLRREESYGYLHALWWLRLADGRSAVSVVPGAGEAVRHVAEAMGCEEALMGDALAAAVTGPVSAALRAAGVAEVSRVLHDLVFACDATALRLHECPALRRLVDDSVPAAPGISLPTQCFPRGIAYGVVEAGHVVSVAYGHRTGTMEDRVVDLGVETAPEHRRKGYAQACVSAVAAHVIDRGGQARYGCSPANTASIATARSVGFAEYGQSLILSAPPG